MLWSPARWRGCRFRVTHVNLYDDTIEGCAHKELPIQCVQHHPEASPGPHDSLHLIADVLPQPAGPCPNEPIYTRS
jgi:carbamoylphosphate synthase small subunit